MPEYATHWRRVVGSGVVYDGPCVLRDIIFDPHATTQYVEIYDGRDSTSGILFARIDRESHATWQMNLGRGVLFGRGIYVASEHREDAVTVAFNPCD